MIYPFIAIFLGGGLGSVMRYAVQEVVHERLGTGIFPVSTFTVNIVGSMLIGMFYALSARFSFSDEVRLFLTAGLCGGFTTFSTFSNDMVAMIRTGEWTMALIYTILSVVLGILACFAGAWLCSRS